MDVVWSVPCDVRVEQCNPRTGGVEATWLVKGTRIVLQDNEDAKSAVLYVPRHGQSIPVPLRGAQLSVHSNFLSQGLCSIRLRSPRALTVMLSAIQPYALRAAVNLLEAVSASTKGKPDPQSSSTYTGEGDHNDNDREDNKRRAAAKTAAAARKQRKPSSADSDDDEDDDDDYADQKENMSPATARRMAHAAVAQSDLMKTLQARTKAASGGAGGGGGGSPQRFLSPQAARFLSLSSLEKARVLKAHPTLAQKRAAREAADPTWVSREKAYDAALRDQTLSDEQREVLTLVFRGCNVFFTGSAGTGKSFLISRILSCLPGVGSSTFATSTTGITASHIGGTTLFAWAGWSATAAGDTVEQLVQRVARSRESLARWRSTRTLLVDEVSMLDAALFDRLEAVARRVRGDERPFGGIQLILCGDYFQLPPVTKDGGGGMNASASATANAAPLFAFESQSWSRCVGAAESGGQGRTIELGVVFRQRDDVFIRLLDSVRRGQCPPDAAALLRACEDTDLETLASEDGIRPTSLVSHRKEVEETNTRELALLQTHTVTFHARDTSSSSQALEALSAACPARAKLELKIGAQVLLLRNLGVSSGLSNGARGVVVRFGASPGGGRPGPPVVRFASGSETTIAPVTWSHSLGGQVLASREQVPLELAWALSIHKSQGLTLDRARIDISRCFEHGQAYVALSRMRGLEGLQLVGGFDPKKIRAHPRVIAFYEQLGEERAAAEKARSDKAKATAAAARATQMQAQQRAQAAAAAAAGKPLPIPAAAAGLSAPSISSALMQPSSLSGRIRKSRDDDEEDEKKQMDAPPAAAANQLPPSDEEDDEQPGLLPVLGRKLHFEASDNGNKRRRRRRLAVSSSDSDDDEDDGDRGEGQTRSTPAAAASAALPPLDAFYPPPSSLPLRAL